MICSCYSPNSSNIKNRLLQDIRIRNYASDEIINIYKKYTDILNTLSKLPVPIDTLIIIINYMEIWPWTDSEIIKTFNKH